VAAIHCSCLMLNEYLHGPCSIIEAFGTAHRTCPQCRAVHGERPVIVVRLPYRCAVHRTPQERLSGSMRDRILREHARIMSYSPKCPEIEGLNGGED
jgi:hypothetical protein